MKRTREHIERQEEELQVLGAIYMDDCKDMRKKKSDLPKVCLQLKPLQSVVDKEVHASVDLIVQYTAIYPDQSPKLSLDNVRGLSKVSTSQLQEELEIMAADLVGEVMVLQLAHHVQSFLHKHNIPRLSFYDQMMTNKREEQRRIEAAEKERLREQMEASKEKEEEEKRLIEAELMRREEILRKSRRRRSMIERGETEDQFQQSVKPKDTKENKVVSSAKDLPTSNGEGKVYPLNNVSSLPHSPKKVELSSSDHLITRRKKSSESLGETDTGSRIITFNMKGEHTIYCGRCLGQGSSGSYMYRGMDGTSGDLIVVGEWRFLHPSNLVSPSKINEVPSHDSGRLMKQITSIQQEIVSLTIRVNHPNLVHYLAVKVNDSADNVVIQVLMEYVGGGDMSMFLRPGGIPVAQVKKYIQQLLESLWYLHGKSVVHKDLKLTNVMLDSSGNVRLADYSVGKRLSDLYHAYGMNEGNIPQPKTVEPSKSLSRPGKKGDVFNVGLLILSLLCGDVVEIAEVPLSLPADLQDFLSKCLNVDERERWSAYQLLQHSFIKQQVPSCVVRNEERITGSEGSENALATKKSEPEEPIPDFCYFSCVSGKSRLNDFEQLQFLGKGGFGNVIKVRNILDGGLYAIKRIPLNPKSTQFNRKITREVQLISRVNHENVVRYYNSWIEWSEDDSDSNLTDGGETPVTKAQKDNALPSPQNSNEDSLMKLNIVEAPSIKGTSDEGSWCSYVTSESSESESSSNSSICEAARQNVLSKRIGSSFGISESGSGGITFGNFDESFLQFGDLLDTESEDSEEGSMWPTTTSESSTDSKGIQYLYIQMEYCEKNTLRNLIDEGLFKDQDKIWRHLREIVDGLAHIHSQGIIHRDLKPVNLFLDSNGNIKIGDFGLATTHDISRDGGLFLETHASERPPFKESEGLHTSDAMTGKVGTTFYVAPELAQSSSRVKYSEKVDLYSLGIIFFEMCYRPLTTAMERAHVLGNVRMENIIFPSDFDSKRLKQQDSILKWLLQHKPDKRPTSQELLQSQYIPPKIEDGHLEEVLQHTLQSTKTTRYKRLMAAMFKQRVTPIQDVMYDDMERPSGISYCNAMAQQAVHEKLISLFRRHGAIKLSTSLLVPRTSLFDQFELAVSVMDHNGTIVTLPYDLRIPFARFVARRELISPMKRYDIGVVYRDKRALDPNPKELLECTFDIVSDSNEDQVSVAEVFLVVAEIIKEFPSLEGRNYFIRINHTVIMKSVFVSCGVPEEKHEELFAILQDTKTDKFRKAQISELLENLQVSEQLASELCAFLSFEGSVGKLKEQLPAILKGRAPARASAQALRELEALQSHALAFGVKLRLVFNSSLVYNIQHFSGLIFQFVAVDQRKRKRGGVDILAAGGRYDKLISYFQRATDASHKAIEAVGVSIAFEKIVTAVLDDKETLLPYSSDVLVCSTGSKSMMEERMRIAQELWCAGVKTNLYYYDSRNLNSLEDLQNYCRQTNVGFMVLVKEQESGWVKVWSLKKEKMTEMRTTDLTEYISTKLASCRADAMDGKETGTKLPTHGSQTVSESILSSGPSFSYVLNVSFNTLEKVDKSIKKRHESQMLSKISPKVQQIGIKTIVEIIGVDLPGSVIRNMASQLELDGNYDSYEASIARLTENTPTKLKKYIARVCDNVRELIQDKKMPMVFVYSLKDETYKAFY